MRVFDTYKYMTTKFLLGLLLIFALLPAPAIAQTPSPSAKEVSGIVEIWGNKVQPRSASLSVWQQQIRDDEYAAFQLRADLDLYQFVLSRDQLPQFIDALKNYQIVVRQATPSVDGALGWLYRTEVKLKRLGNEAKDDRLLVNIERKGLQKPTLSLTFDSWLLSFVGPDSPADRAYKGITLQQEGALELQDALEQIVRALPR